MSLVLPSGRPNPYTQPQRQVNPWAGSGRNPSQRQQGYSGDVNQAWEGLQYAAQSGWGRTLGDQEKQKIAQHVQSKGWKGGAVDDAAYNNALGWMEEAYGPRMAGPDPGPGGTQPQPRIGSEQAQNEWRQQAPVAGVPPTFRGPVNQFEGQQNQLMSQILANPRTMGEKEQRVLEERQKESALRMGQQAQIQGAQQMAGRGFAGGSGPQMALNGQVQQNVMQDILRGRQDLAVQMAQQGRQDEFNALDQSMRLQNQQWGQGLDQHNAQMDQARLGLNQMNANRASNLQELLGLHSADMDTLNFYERNRQFDQNYGLDFLRYLTGAEQFDKSFGENQRQFNQNMGLNWAQLSASQQQALMSRILGMF